MYLLSAFLLLGVLDTAHPAPAPVAESSPAFFAADQGRDKDKDKEREKESEQALVRYFQVSKKGIRRSVSMVAHFAGSVPKMKMAAVADARRKVNKDGVVEYEVNGRQGDNSVWKELILRYMNGEMETSTKDRSQVAITTDNYKFKYKGMRERDGRMAYVYELNPRKKREGLFKGEVWLDTETSLPLMESGRFVKSPSVFLKKIQFTREYAIQDGVPVPKAMQTSIETRFWGPAELDIQYSQFRWEEALPALE
ncbi:MAG: hypothetical protein HY821_15855 [Acidobacteria bacterium]|nr:hypothetical protein [Acidobacteriota bacterium]